MAVDQVFYGEDINHIFCEIDPFCTAILRKHWPDGEYWGDITDLFIAYTENKRVEGLSGIGKAYGQSDRHPTILTGGFPCQPFSAAGQRRGTADNRYLWPQMLSVIHHVKPDWVIAENVFGLVTWDNGLVLEQVCTDLENEGYEVQPLVIPAVSVNAPHRRDRVWIIAYRRQQQEGGEGNRLGNRKQSGYSQGIKTKAGNGFTNKDQDWNQDWIEVATRLCRVDDGVSRRVDRLKALGNAIVPQVAMEILNSIKYASLGNHPALGAADSK